MILGCPYQASMYSPVLYCITVDCCLLTVLYCLSFTHSTVCCLLTVLYCLSFTHSTICCLLTVLFVVYSQYCVVDHERGELLYQTDDMEKPEVLCGLLLSSAKACTQEHMDRDSCIRVSLQLVVWCQSESPAGSMVSE